MFKYLWILIIIAILGTVAFFTVKAVKDMECDDIEDLWEDMWDYHDGLMIFWSIVIGLTLLVLFVTSLHAFCQIR